MRKAAVSSQPSAVSQSFTVHEHLFISGPRATPGYRKDQKWHDERQLQHSHVGGDVPHRHPDAGPSHGYRNAKTTTRPFGDQLEYIAATEEESTFTVVVTDSALVSTLRDGLQSIGDTPLEAIGFPAAERMMTNCRLKCIVRDERKAVRS